MVEYQILQAISSNVKKTKYAPNIRRVKYYVTKKKILCLKYYLHGKVWLCLLMYYTIV